MRAIRFEIDGQIFDQWEEAAISRDLKNFTGTFAFTCRDNVRSLQTFLYASEIPPVYQLRPGAAVKILVHGEMVLAGFIETVSPEIDENEARVSISGKDKAGDLIDCAAAPDGPAEFNNVTLAEAARRIAAPFGLTVRSDIDAGGIFRRYSIDMAETGLSALEKAARQSQALLLSDGIGSLVITRTGAGRAPADLRLPGNVKSARGTFTHKGRYSKTIIRGQSEQAAGKRPAGGAPLGAGKTIPPEERKSGNGEAGRSEAAGVTATGIAGDSEVKRHRPRVHLARTKGDKEACKREAHWRSRAARGQSEEMHYTVAGFQANGRLWRVNEMAFVSDTYQAIERDMLICGVTFRESDQGRITELAIISPEAFDNRPVKGRRKNKKGKKKGPDGPVSKGSNK